MRIDEYERKSVRWERLLPWAVLALATGVVALYLSGCSAYRVYHSETNGPDGTVLGSETGIVKIVPPGGKDLSEGSLSLGVDKDGAWTMNLGESGQTDLSGTAALIQGVIDQIVKLAAANGALSQQNQALQAIVKGQQAQIPAPGQ